MKGNDGHLARGTIAIVQEDRFRLMTDDGQGLLLTLARDAALDGEDLLRLYRAGTHVEAEYSGEPNVETGLAHAVRPLRPAE